MLALPADEQDAIASQILASLAEEEAWKKRFAKQRDVIGRMARKAREEDERGDTLPLGCSHGRLGNSGVYDLDYRAWP